MRENISLFLFSIFFGSFMNVAEAKFISIETTTTVTMKNNEVGMRVSLANKGDEPAHNVTVNVEIMGKQLKGPLKDKLGVNEKYNEEFTTKVDFQKPGRYPVVVNVGYTDANLYPFTALSVALLNFKESANARVVGIIPQTKLAKNGKIPLTVNNIDVAERKFHFRLVSPKEIFIANPEGDISVDSGADKTVSFDARNISALPGSSYPLFVLLEYEDGGYHYSAVNSGNIIIKKQELVPDAYKKPLLAVLIAVFAGILFYNFRKASLSRKITRG